MNSQIECSPAGAVQPGNAGPAPRAAPLARLDVKGLFPTPLVVADLDEPETINRALRADVLARATGAGVLKSNCGGWQSDEDFAEWGGDAGRRVLAAASDLAHAVTVVDTDGALQRVAFAWRVRAWANLNRSGDSNVVHAHPGAVWSGTYYVDDGGAAGDDAVGGAFEMLDPRGVAPQMYAPNLCCGIAGCATAGRAEQIRPRTGQLILFPAWLMHGVTPYRGGGTRISIAFNLSV